MTLCLNKVCACADLLSTTNQRELWHVLVGDLEDNGFSFDTAVAHADLNTGLNIEVRYFNLSGEHIPVPVVFHGGCSLGRLSTLRHKNNI